MADVDVRWVVPGSAHDPKLKAVAEPGGHPSRAYELLVVVPTVPYPPIWGFGQRAFQLARHLARKHRVTILCYAAPDQLPDVESMAQHVHEVVAVPRESDPLVRRRLLQLRYTLSRLPYHAAGLRTSALQSAVDDTMARRKPDAVILESSQMGWLALPPEVAVITDEHNIESELLGRMAASEDSPIRRGFNGIEFKRYHRFEAKVWERSSGCAATSRRDASMIQERCPEVPVGVVPNGVDIEDFAPAGQPEVTNRLIFTGLLDYRPNHDGIMWFVDEVFPLIQGRQGGVQLQIVGHGSPEVLTALRRPGVEVTGRVPDLRANLEQAAVAVVPLRIGGGTRLKVVEAMSMSKAIVSTTLGAEGINVVSGREALLADEPQQFADAVCRLLDDPETRHRLGANARALTVGHYSWQQSADKFTALLEQVVGPNRNATEHGPAHVPGTHRREGTH